MNCFRLTGLVVCSIMIANCAGSPRIYRAAAPQVEMPPEATRPCAIYRLPDTPSEADLEIGYATRGAQLVACNAARDLAVGIHAAEHQLEAVQAKARSARQRPWWAFWR